MRTFTSISSVLILALLTLGGISLGACAGKKKAAKPTSSAKPRPRPTPETGSVSTPTPPKDEKLETVPSSQIAFIKSNKLMPVLEEANKQNKPVFVEFYASWCAPCKVLEKEVLNTQEVAAFVNSNFVSVKISIENEDGKAVAQLYNAGQLPTMLFLDKKGNELGRMIGTTTPGRFMRAGADALAKVK